MSKAKSKTSSVKFTVREMLLYLLARGDKYSDDVVGERVFLSIVSGSYSFTGWSDIDIVTLLLVADEEYHYGISVSLDYFASAKRISYDITIGNPCSLLRNIEEGCYDI